MNAGHALPPQPLQILTQLLQLVSLVLLCLHQLQEFLLGVLIESHVGRDVVVDLVAVECHDGLWPLMMRYLQRRHGRRRLSMQLLLRVHHGSLPRTLHLIRDVVGGSRCSIDIGLGLHTKRVVVRRLVELMIIANAIVEGLC